MGTIASAKRSVIDRAFEASSGDMRGNIEPVFISGRPDGKDVATCEVRANGAILEVGFRLLGASLDDADFARVFAIAYLDVFTSHYWHNQTRPKLGATSLRFSNQDSGASWTIPYPDPE
jgi:hypothetical protein